jgi:hypothetical protein
MCSGINMLSLYVEFTIDYDDTDDICISKDGRLR